MRGREPHEFFNSNYLLLCCILNRHECTQSGDTIDTMKEAKYIDFHTALMELFTVCIKCFSADCAVTTTQSGTFLLVKQRCLSCNHIRVWNSQPLFGTHGTAAGNLLLSASILFSGASSTQVLRVLEFMSIPTISSRTFFRHQSLYLLPSISRLWNQHRIMLIGADQGRGSPLNLGGDG